MPKFIRPFFIFIRNNLLASFVAGLPNNPNRWHYRYDGVAVSNSSAFMDDIKFQAAYNALTKAYGWNPELPWRVHQIMWAVGQVRNLNGSFVECGVGRGGLMSSLLETYDTWNEDNKKMYLFDTFESYQYNKQGKKIISNAPNKFYAKSFSEVKNNFAQYKNIEFVVGDVLETVYGGVCGNIAFISIDMNQSKAEEHVFRKLYPDLLSGGVIILDDYYAAGRDLQRLSMDKLSIEFGFGILATPSGQGIIVKK